MCNWVKHILVFYFALNAKRGFTLFAKAKVNDTLLFALHTFAMINTQPVW